MGDEIIWNSFGNLSEFNLKKGIDAFVLTTWHHTKSRNYLYCVSYLYTSNCHAFVQIFDRTEYFCTNPTQFTSNNCIHCTLHIYRNGPVWVRILATKPIHAHRRDTKMKTCVHIPSALLLCNEMCRYTMQFRRETITNSNFLHRNTIERAQKVLALICFHSSWFQSNAFRTKKNKKKRKS